MNTNYELRPHHGQREDQLTHLVGPEQAALIRASGLPVENMPLNTSAILEDHIQPEQPEQPAGPKKQRTHADLGFSVSGIKEYPEEAMVLFSQHLTEQLNDFARGGADEYHLIWVNRIDAESNPDGDNGFIRIIASRPLPEHTAEHQLDLVTKVLIEEFGGPLEGETFSDAVIRIMRGGDKPRIIAAV